MRPVSSTGRVAGQLRHVTCPFCTHACSPRRYSSTRNRPSRGCPRWDSRHRRDQRWSGKSASTWTWCVGNKGARCEVRGASCWELLGAAASYCELRAPAASASCECQLQRAGAGCDVPAAKSVGPSGGGDDCGASPCCARTPIDRLVSAGRRVCGPRPSLKTPTPSASSFPPPRRFSSRLRRDLFRDRARSRLVASGGECLNFRKKLKN